MADGRSIGSVFVELDLDASRYTKGQQQLYKDATQTSLKIEDNFKKLNIKSSAEFDLMRQKATNAFNGIKNSHQATANDIMRAEKAKADTIKRINEQQYGHQQSLMKQLKSNYMAIAATVAIVAGMVTKLTQAYMEEEAAHMKLAVAMGNAGTYTRANLAAMKDYAAQLQQTTKYGDEMTMATMANLQTYGMEIDQLKAATKASMDLSAAKGIDLVRASELVGKAFVGETGTLSRYGIVLADGIDKSKKFEAVLELIQQRFGGTAQAELETYAGQWAKIKNWWGDLAEKGGLVLLKTLEAVQFAFGMVAAGFYTVLEGLVFRLASLVSFAEKLPLIGDKFKGLRQELEFIAQGYENAKNKALGFSDTNLKMLTSFDRVSAFADKTFGGKTPTTKETDAIKASLKDIDKAAKDAAKEAAERIKRNYDQAVNEMLDEINMGVAATEKSLKEIAEKAKAALDYNALMRDEQLTSMSPYQQAIEMIKDAEREKYDYIQQLRDKDLISEQQAAAAKELISRNSAVEIQAINAETYQSNIAALSAGFGQLESAFSSIALLYKEGSKDAEQWEEAAKAMEIAQRACAVVAAVVGIATQASGDPYSAFVRVAAMAAAMGALLASIGESVGGTSASVAAASRSTVLGAEAGTGSESIANSLAILQDTYDMTNVRLTSIYTEIKNLNNNITGLVTAYVRTGGVNFDGVDIERFNKAGFLEREISSRMINQDMGILTTIGNFLNRPLEDINKLTDAIFGGEVKVKDVKTGLALGQTSVGQMMSGDNLNVRNWQKVVTKESGGWFGDDKWREYNYYAAADKNVESMFNLVYAGISKSLVYISEEFGTDVNKAMAYAFKQINLNLAGKTTEEINKTLTEYFNRISDEAVDKIFGDMLRGYQQLNEGLMETAIRLIAQKEAIAAILEMTNQTFNGTTTQFIKFSDSLVKVAGSLDKLTDAFSTYYDLFFSDAEKQADYKKQLSQVMGSYGFALPTSRSGYRDIVEGLNLTTEAGMAAYYSLMAVSDTADKYYKYLENKTANVKESDYATKVEYMRAVHGYASGGVASGLAWVGEHGKELAYFDQPTRIYSHSDSKKIMSEGELLAEIRALREDLNAGNYQIAANTQKSAKYLKFLEQWDAEGQPEERT